MTLQSSANICCAAVLVTSVLLFFSAAAGHPSQSHLAEHAKRADPVATSCYASEKPMGRYCDRTTGLVTTWYERCWKPQVRQISADNDEESLADRKQQLEQELGTANLDSAYPGYASTEDYVYFKGRPGTTRHHEQACPGGWLCLQAIDDDEHAHVFCKKFTKDETADVDDLYEPFGPEGTMFKVDPAKEAQDQHATEAGQVTVVERRFKIVKDMGIDVAVLIYDPDSMRLIEPTRNIEVFKETPAPTPDQPPTLVKIENLFMSRRRSSFAG